MTKIYFSKKITDKMKQNFKLLLKTIFADCIINSVHGEDFSYSELTYNIQEKYMPVFQNINGLSKINDKIIFNQIKGDHIFLYLVESVLYDGVSWIFNLDEKGEFELLDLCVESDDIFKNDFEITFKNLTLKFIDESEEKEIK